MIERADKMEMDDRRELQRMLESTTRLGKGGDAIRRLYVEWCFEEVARVRGYGRISPIYTVGEYTVETAMADLQLVWHHHGFPPEVALLGLQELLKRCLTDIDAFLPTAGDASRTKKVVVQLAGVKTLA